jgi:hypothetical protein
MDNSNTASKAVKVPALESQLKQTKKEIENLMKAIMAGVVTKTTKAKLEQLEAEQETLEVAIIKEKSSVR